MKKLEGMKSRKKKLILTAGILLLAVLAVTTVFYMTKGEDSVDFTVLEESAIPPEISSQVIPEYRSLERALACVVGDTVYVMVSRGEKPTSGYGITVDRMYIEEKDGATNLVVCADFTDPEPGIAVSQILTYPIQIAQTALPALPDRIELRVQYQ